MAKCEFAIWNPISGSAGNYTGGPFKVVHHKTQGTLSGALGAYKANKSDPHFTVYETGIRQHIDTKYAARSLRNASGGVQTNRDSAIQIEIVGYSGVDMPKGTMDHLVRLLKWIEEKHNIHWTWPEGRPPTSSATGYGLYTGERHAEVWDTKGGHYGHSQVPENTHWDPAYTDLEWWILNDRMSPEPVATEPTQPPLQPIVYGPIMEVDVQYRPVTVNIRTDDQGNGWVTVPHPIDSIIGFLGQGLRPGVDGWYMTTEPGFAPEDETTVVSLTEAQPNTDHVIYLRVAM